MPMHSSNNYYKAEQDYQDYHDREDWVHLKKDFWYYEEEPHYYEWRYYDYNYDLDGKFVKVYGHRPKKEKSRPFKCWDNCDFCYEYATKGRKQLIEEYFTPKEILETLQSHLLDKNCWCYERVRTHVLQRRVDKMLRGGSSMEYKDDILTDCVVQILDKQLGKEIKALHDTKVHNQKIALLARYGLTVEDYEKSRIENKRLQESQLVLLQDSIQALPKQKFIKVKESMLKEGEFY